MNNVSLSGRLTKDIELNKTQGGKYYTRFCLAVKRRVKSGEHPQSDFIDCVAWEKTAEILAKYCNKGDQINVSGRIQTNAFEKDGEKRKSTDVIVSEIDLLGTVGGGKEEKAQDDQVEQAEPLPFEI